MPTPQQEAPNNAVKDALWLEVQLNDERWFFELHADDDAAVTVGSHPSAQVQIVSPGVAATHFHFERERNELVAVPGYRAGLRINSIKAPGPTRLSEHATIDFSGVALKVDVHRTRPANFDGRVNRRSSTPAEYLRALPGESDATGVALPAAPPLPTFSSFDTMEAAPPRFRTEGLVPLGAAPLPNPGPDMGPQGTVVMRVVRPAATPEPPPTPERPALAFDPSRTERLAVALTVADRVDQLPSPDATPTRAEIPSLRRSGAPPPPDAVPPAVAPATPETPLAVVVPVQAEAIVPVAPVVPVRSLLPEPAIGTKTADFDVAAMAPFFVTPAAGVAPAPAAGVLPAPAPVPAPRAPAPVSSEPAPAIKSIPAPKPSARSTMARAPAWLAAIGRSAQQRPLPVATAALGGSLVLALALVGVSRLASTGSNVRPRETHAMVGTTPAVIAAPAKRVVSIATTPPEPEVGTGSGAQPKQLLDAATHLTAGRYGEAEVAYRALASAQPATAAYAGIANMLERAGSPGCRQKPPASSCPEVIP